MGWLGRLFGRRGTPAPAPVEKVAVAPQNPYKRGWENDYEMERQEATTREYFEALARALALDEMTIVPRLADEQSDLHGRLQGYPLKVTLDWRGSVREITLQCVPNHGEEDKPWLDIQYDEDVDKEEVNLGPGVFVDGDQADAAAAEFHRLPADLQNRLITVVREYLHHFRSSEFAVKIVLRDHSLKWWAGDPVVRLQRPIALAAELQIARGIKPAGRNKETTEPKEFATQLAKKIASQLSGANIVERDADTRVDVRWVESDIPTWIELDYGKGYIDLAARATGVAGFFSVTFDEEVTEAKLSAGEVEDAEEHYVFLSKHLHTSGPDADVQDEAALFRTVGPDLVGELVATGEELRIGFTLFEELVETRLFHLDDVTDNGATAIRVARLLARTAAALPRG